MIASHTSAPGKARTRKRPTPRERGAARAAFPWARRAAALGACAVLAVPAGTVTARAQRCSDYTRCEQAVENWCEGRHGRADGDSDGIPCENVCKSKEEADRLRQGRTCPR